jgi:hypothetical protein
MHILGMAKSHLDLEGAKISLPTWRGGVRAGGKEKKMAFPLLVNKEQKSLTIDPLPLRPAPQKDGPDGQARCCFAVIQGV